MISSLSLELIFVFYFFDELFLRMVPFMLFTTTDDEFFYFNQEFIRGYYSFVIIIENVKENK